MTTAARPTFEPARGGSSRGEKDLSAISKQYSSRDLPAHTKLKQREAGQGTTDELRGRDFRRELEERERQARDKRGDAAGGSSRRRAEPLAPAALDVDDVLDEDESDEESDDDEAELMAELQRIRKERAAEAVKRDAERKQEEERIRMENILSGNPLLSYSGAAAKGDARVKRRWDDDVVFKNCARAEPERKQPRFINDALRNDFHKKFMDKYVK
ncbi:protein CWC15 homolog [Pollicipes pollicipes]|uniref:protein CWC15 homolog n=1 Tax=Pollicipes pollicipes TaxID=41117 RepID=UPI001884C423|nr:protein CWC15 homolog [Pollicipes pollicipes]XP_037079974.1 protein CWC15 homolog [Pollicipes pollicipes]